ncbi:MAG: DNA-protecting protein DprA [Elusimicrobia bacterium]|nr:DNA-protecting protein DprA [Elusimicrobiota bacterium]
MTVIQEREKLAKIKLNAFPYLRTDWIARLADLYGGAAEILKKSPGDISKDGAVSIETARRFLEAAGKMDPEKEIKEVSKNGGRILTSQDPDFPELLKAIYDPPLVLYVRGDIRPKAPAVALVGTRRPTNYGKKTADEISSALASAGLVIVSGLARGIDTECHLAAVKAGGITWAVLGTGIDVCYPWENKKLAERIIETGGALISEYSLGTRPLPAHFPRRNRIISGLSYSTVVIEGGFNSGALITAKTALEQGRELLAVPGPIDSQMSLGPNKLIRDGAMPVLDSSDVVSTLPAEVVFGLKIKKSKRKICEEGLKEIKNLSDESKKVLEFVKNSENGASIDEIAGKFDWPIHKVVSAVFELETTNIAHSSENKVKLV